MTDYIRSFCAEFDWPEEAADAFVSAYEKIQSVPAAKLLFDQQLNNYECLDTNAALAAVWPTSAKVAQLTGIISHTTDMVFAICLTKHMHELYRQAGIPEQNYRDSALDLRCKLYECKNVRKEWGSFVAPWFTGFYNMSLIGLGRLEFEYPHPIGDPDFAYECDGRVYRTGDLCIGMHIPSSGPLDPEACMDSFRQAYRMFSPRFPEGRIPMICSSWLLFAEHEKFLPEHSRIRQFMKFFDIWESHDSPKFGDCWRIFGQGWRGSLEGFPRDTSLQRAYYDWIASGHEPGTGRGIFIFDGENIRHGHLI